MLNPVILRLSISLVEILAQCKPCSSLIVCIDYTVDETNLLLVKVCAYCKKVIGWCVMLFLKLIKGFYHSIISDTWINMNISAMVYEVWKQKRGFGNSIRGSSFNILFLSPPFSFPFAYFKEFRAVSGIPESSFISFLCQEVHSIYLLLLCASIK